MDERKVAVRGITLDVADLDRSTDFWSRLLEVGPRSATEDYVWLDEVAPGVTLILQRVAETKTIKNRVHLELVATDAEATISRVVELGGTRIDDLDETDYALTVMGDPDGNEFCISRRPSVGLLAANRDAMMEGERR